MITESKSIGIFIDGGYFSKINEALSDQLSLNILSSTYKCNFLGADNKQ